MSTAHQHVFLFRHCVRSAYRHIDLYDHDAHQESSYPTDIADYLGVPLPDWHAAGEGQCTRAGLDALTGTGKVLLRDHLLAKQYDQQPQKQQILLQVDFRADMTSQRDVDSAWALQQGMAEFLNHYDISDDDDDTYHDGNGQQQLHKIDLQGLGTIQDDAEFFHPTQLQRSNTDEERQEPICSMPPETPASIAARNAVLQSRLDSISMPESLDEIMAAIEILGETSRSKVGPLRHISPRVDINRNISKLSGAVLAVADIGELAYLARASGHITFLEQAATSGIYNLLAWHDWRRSVTDVGTTAAALQGAVKVSRILNLLEGKESSQHQYGMEENYDDDQIHHYATILVGHDDDFAAVATALGLTWTLPPPYTSGKSEDYYNAVPPGAALHFYYNPDNDDDDDVQISTLIPIMLSSSPHHHEPGQPHHETLNTTGILEEGHVHLSRSFAQVIQDGLFAESSGRSPTTGSSRGQHSSSSSSSSKNKTGIDHLRDRLVHILSTYPPEAMDCLKNVTQKEKRQHEQYFATGDILTSAGLSSSSPSASTPPPVGVASATLALSLVIMVVLIVIFGTRRLKMSGGKKPWLTATTNADNDRYPRRPASQTEMTSIITTTCATEP